MVNTRAERLRTVRASSRSRASLQLVKPAEAIAAPGYRGLERLASSDTGIASAEAAAAVGMDPFKSPVRLWMEKTGRQDLLHPTQVRDDRLTDWGWQLEPLMAAHYARRTGRRVLHTLAAMPAVLQHPHYPWMLASAGREVVGARDVQLLECVSVGIPTVQLWDGGIPTYLRLQVLHRLAVTGARAADVVVLMCGHELQVYRIERDETLIARLIEQERAFWRCVELDQAPPADARPLDDALS